MAFFNPQYIQYNPNAAIIQGAGAVGKSLYDVYKDNVARQQAYNLQQETNRANLARESEISRHNAVTEANQTKGLDIQQQGVNNTANHYANMQKHYNDNLAFNKDKFNTELKIKQAEINAKRAEIQAGKIAKAQEERDKFINEFNTAAQIATQTGFSPDENFNKLTPQEKFSILKAYNDPGVRDARKAQAESIKSEAKQTAGQKNQIAKLQNDITGVFKELSALDAVIKAGSSAGGGGGISNLGGLWDSMAYSVPNLSPDSNTYRTAASNYANVYADRQKGQGKFNNENAVKLLTPTITGAESAAEYAISRRKQLMDELSFYLSQAQEQGYMGVDEIRQRVAPLLHNSDDIRDYLFGKKALPANFGASVLYGLPDEPQKQQPQTGSQQDISQKMKARAKQPNNPDFYEMADEYGGKYWN